MSSTQIRVLIDAKGTVSGLGTVENGFKRVQAQAQQTQKAIERAYKINFNASSFNSVSNSAIKAMQQVNKLNPAFQKVAANATLSGRQIATSLDVSATIPGLSNVAKSINGIGSAFTAVQTIVTGGLIGAAVIRGISAAVDESVNLQNALIGVESVAKSFGQDTTEVKKAVLDFTKDGLVSATDAALAFKQILSTGTQLPDAIRLMNSLKDAAAFNRQGFYSLGEAIVATTEGIKNGTSARADAVGITTNLSQFEAQYAAALGRTVGSLTDAEKYQARVNGFIREGGVYAGDAAKLIDTYSGSVSALGTAYSRAMAKIGDFITQSSVVKGTISIMTKFLNDVALDEKSSDFKISSIKSQLNGFLKDVDVKDSPYKKRLIEELAELEKQVTAQKKITEETTKKKQAEIEAKNAAAVNAKVAGDAAKERAKQIKALDKALKAAGETELDTLKRVRDERLKLVGPNDAKRRILIEKDFAFKVNKLNEENHAKQVRRANQLAQLNKRLQQEAITNGANSPFSKAVMPAGLTDEQKKKFELNTNLGRGVGILNSVVGGKEGAKGLVVAGAAAGLDALAPGLGQAAQPLLKAFAEGPDSVKQMVNEFADALPDVITGFIEAIPVFIETLVDRAPDIIERLAEKAPDIIVKLVEATPRIALKMATAMPMVALRFGTELIKNLPRIVSEAARAIYDALARILSQLNPFDGGDNSFFSGSADNGFMGTGIHFASGGEVPKSSGVPFRDSVPATLMPGERILDLETNRAFKEMVRNGGGNKNIETLLARVIDLLEQPMVVNSETKINNSVLAQAMLLLSRTQQRIS